MAESMKSHYDALPQRLDLTKTCPGTLEELSNILTLAIVQAIFEDMIHLGRCPACCNTDIDERGKCSNESISPIQTEEL